MISKLALYSAMAALMLSACSERSATQAADGDPAGRQSSAQVGMAAFVSSDRNQDGIIDRKEVETMAQSMFVSMDYNDNGTVTPDEFDKWDFGLVTTTQEEGKLEAFRAAKRILFALQDLNSDLVLDPDEHLKSLDLGFVRADHNDSGAMEKDEYARAFLPNIVFRAALEENP